MVDVRNYITITFRLSGGHKKPGNNGEPTNGIYNQTYDLQTGLSENRMPLSFMAIEWGNLSNQPEI